MIEKYQVFEVFPDTIEVL